VAKITGFSVTAINQNAGNITIVGVFSNGEEYHIPMNEDTTLAYAQELVKQEMKRRNKLDDLHISLQSVIGVTVLV
jgi:hypothetical protein